MTQQRFVTEYKLICSRFIVRTKVLSPEHKTKTSDLDNMRLLRNTNEVSKFKDATEAGLLLSGNKDIISRFIDSQSKDKLLYDRCTFSLSPLFDRHSYNISRKP